MIKNISHDSTKTLICYMRELSSSNTILINTIQVYHRPYNCIAYPLFFPFGTDGWSLNTMSQTNGNKVTLVQYVRLHMKRDFYSFFAWWETFVSAVCNRPIFKFLKFHIEVKKTNLRSDVYRGVVDSYSGRMVILPASFTGVIYGTTINTKMQWKQWGLWKKPFYHHQCEF